MVIFCAVGLVVGQRLKRFRDRNLTATIICYLEPFTEVRFLHRTQERDKSHRFGETFLGFFLFIAYYLLIKMIKCNESCQLFFKCESSGLMENCVFDNGICQNGDDSDEFLEKITY